TAAADTAAAPVVVLAKGVIHAMFWKQIKLGALMLTALVLVGSGVGWAILHGFAREATPLPEEARPGPQPAPQPKASEPAVKDGLSITVTPAKAVFAYREALAFTITL